MVETVTKRLHIGGLTPNITSTHLKDRFKIFGQVDEVEELQPDALGKLAGVTAWISTAYTSRPAQTLRLPHDADNTNSAQAVWVVLYQLTPAVLPRASELIWSGMNILSGSMYRGTQLRIAEAKPRYTEKLKAELSPPAALVEKKRINKRKRARREMGPEVGKEAQDMGVVTEENHTRSKASFHAAVVEEQNKLTSSSGR
jgi:hypothetical protein